MLSAACGAACAGKYRSVEPLNIDAIHRYALGIRELSELTHNALAILSGSRRGRPPRPPQLDRILQQTAENNYHIPEDILKRFRRKNLICRRVPGLCYFDSHLTEAAGEDSELKYITSGLDRFQMTREST